ncbi:MAG: hypothetical protein ACYDH9_20330 [Limisphaerales bacterium]
MRNLLFLTVISAMLGASSVSGQNPPQITAPYGLPIRPPQSAAEASFTKFNLDFPGGTPGELVKAIEKASGKPLNVIIALNSADAQLPPLKMTGVTVPKLFEALTAATMSTVHYRYGGAERTDWFLRHC